jgi:iron complex outermembrane receptor protein
MAAANAAARTASRNFWRLTQVATAVALLCAVEAAQAQEAAASKDAPENVAEVVVTGSRIRGVAPVGSSVVTVGPADIAAAGAVSTAKILQEVPQVFNLGVSESSRGQAGGAGNISYASSINLRGIGPYATLTLVDGHRVVGQGTTGATVDPSIIPALALQRVEIVADGASAIYGSDAVAGVANLVLRRNREDLQAMVRYGFADGYRERQAGALWGHKWKGGQVTLSFENSFHSALNGQDRDFYTGDLTAWGGGDFRSSQCAPGNIIIGGVNYPIPAGGVTKASAAALVAGAANKCDNLKYADLMPRQERNSGVITFNQQITPGIGLFVDGFATRRTYRLSPTILASNLTVPQSNPFYVRPAGAPAGTSETVAYSFINDLAPNVANGWSVSREATAGLDIALGKGWKGTLLYTVGHNEDLAETVHGLNTAAITAALADTNPATALNVFGGANNPATLAAIANNLSISPGRTLFRNAAVKADGPLFALPAGLVRAAVGLERQAVITQGGQTTGPATNPSSGWVVVERTVKSAFAELAIPLVGAANALPGVRKLDLNVAGRHDSYSDVGITNNPKAGLNWSPVENVMMHASYGTSFRAPGLTQVRGFSNGGRGGLYVQNYSDPTIGGALRVGVSLSASNPDLKPETARTRSLGVDWTPAIGTQTKFGLNYFDVKYDNQITGVLSDLTILNREAQFAGTGVITRNPSAALVAELVARYPLASGVLPSTWTLFVDGSNKNLGSSITRGFDFSASTRIPAGDFGDFGIGINGTRFTKYAYAITAAAPMIDQLNYIYNPLKLKARLNVSWSQGPYMANVFVNYLNGYINNLSTPVQQVSSNTTLDARLNYDLSSGFGGTWARDMSVAVGVVNLFDRKPPFVNIAQSTNGGGGFDPTTTNPVGRTISITFDKHF